MPRRAKKAPGVLGVYTYADVEAAKLGTIKCIAPIKNRDGSAPSTRAARLLASDRVRHVGEPVAMVVAETLAQAKDAAELIEVDYEPLPAVIDPVGRGEAGRPPL